MPSHLRQKDKADKLGILDVRVLLNNKEQIDIEIQVTSSEYWAERTLFYLGKMFVDQLKPGEDYQKLEKCIHVGILNFTLFEMCIRDSKYIRENSSELWEAAVREKRRC